jgi:Transposase IS116/IS110/IS902 family
MQAVMRGASHWTDHLERDGRRDRQWCGVLQGRGFGAWLGLVPRHISTGGRTILSKVSKQGNRYLRVLFVQPLGSC